MQIEHKLNNIVYLIKTELETYKSLRCSLLQLDWCIDSVLTQYDKYAYTDRDIMLNFVIFQMDPGGHYKSTTILFII